MKFQFPDSISRQAQTQTAPVSLTPQHKNGRQSFSLYFTITVSYLPQKMRMFLNFCATVAKNLCRQAFSIRSFMIQFTCEQELNRTLRKGMSLPNERQFIKE